jgi:hypothetical protein
MREPFSPGERGNSALSHGELIDGHDMAPRKYADERRIAYEALRRAGLSHEEAQALIGRADDYFKSIGVTPSTPTRIPGNR